MKRFLSLLLTLVIFMSGLTNVVNAEDTGASCLVRIEGLSGTIAEDYGNGTTAAEVAIDVLNKKKIHYTGDKNYISEIDNIKSGSLQGGYDGWMSYVKHADGKTVDQPYPYTPVAGDEIVFYYSNKDMNTPFVNSIKFTPDIVKVNEAFTMKFGWKHDIYDSNWNAISTTTPISKVNVKIDNENYVTDDNGQISVKGLHNGKHTYEISGYNKGQPPSVVMDKGSFIIDGETTSGFNYTDSSYDNITKDNNKIDVDINNEVSATSKVLMPISDNWVAMDMQKLGINSNKDFLENLAQDISYNGLASYSNTDLEKAIIGITAAGYSPYNFEAQNLVEELYNRQLSSFQINDLIFALDAYNYANIKEKYNINKVDIVNAILNKSLSNSGGWSISGNSLDADITGMAISSLAPYYNSNAMVKSKVDKAVQAISSMENNSGYIGSNNGLTSETLSMVILGLTAIGIDPSQSPFIRQNGNIVTALLSFKGNGGMYKHNLNGSDDYMATEEALRALIALQKLKTSDTYNFYSTNIDASQLPAYDYKLENKETEYGTKSVIKEAVSNVMKPSKVVKAADEGSKSQVIEANSVIQAETGNDEITINSEDNKIGVILPKDIINIPNGSKLYFSQRYLSSAEASKVIDKIPINLKIVGNIFSLNLVLKEANGEVSEIHNFKPGKRAKVTVSLKGIKNIDPSKLAAYYFNESKLKWEKVEGSKGVFDNSNSTFTFETPHFTTFAIFEGNISLNKISSKPFNSTKSIFDSTIIICSVLLIIAVVLFVLILGKRGEKVEEKD